LCNAFMLSRNLSLFDPFADQSGADEVWKMMIKWETISILLNNGLA